MTSISYRTFDRWAKRIEREALERHGRCTAATTFSQQCFLMRHGARIVDVQEDRKRLVLEGDWKQAMRDGSMEGVNA